MAAFEDTCTEISADTDLEDHTPDVGTGWTLVSGTKGNGIVDSGADAIAQVSTGGAWEFDNLGSADHTHTFDLIQNANGLYSNWFGCVRLVDSANFIGVEQDVLNSSRLVKLVTSSKTTLVDMTHAASDTYEIRAVGSTIQVYRNASQEGSDQTVTDVSTSETSMGVALVGSARTNGCIDNILGDTIAGGETPPSGTLTLNGFAPNRIKRIYERPPAHGT